MGIESWLRIMEIGRERHEDGGNTRQPRRGEPDGGRAGERTQGVGWSHDPDQAITGTRLAWARCAGMKEARDLS